MPWRCLPFNAVPVIAGVPIVSLCQGIVVLESESGAVANLPIAALLAELSGAEVVCANPCRLDGWAGRHPAF